ncbi:MAG: hypothetical protein K2L31_06360 [Muribaculum sp.]|nr:hypothetical protein [Muribaculum sp.]MDE6458204.1 hypothetical protein [Muribaculum sp.]
MDLDSKPDNFLSEETAEPVIKFDGSAPADTDTPSLPEKPRKRHKFRRVIWWCVVVMVLALAAVCWLRYVNPYETDMEERGYVVDFKRQGIIFKTWEGQMLVKSALIDTTSTYSRDFVFSVDNDEVAHKLAAAKGTGREVTVSYKRYWGILPWRGATSTVITSVR